MTTKLDAFHTPENFEFQYAKNFVVRKLYKESGEPFCNVEIVFTKDPHEDNDGLELKFIQVVDLKIGDLNAVVGCFPQIHDVRSRGWENVRYKAIDEEEDSFSLCCLDFEARRGRWINQEFHALEEIA